MPKIKSFFIRNPNKQVKYFASFSAIKDGAHTFGNVECFRSQPIKSIDDIREIEDVINKELAVQAAFIINWRRFDL